MTDVFWQKTHDGAWEWRSNDKLIGCVYKRGADTPNPVWKAVYSYPWHEIGSYATAIEAFDAVEEYHKEQPND